MVVTLTGDNAFELKRELHRLSNGFVAEYGELAIERLDGAEAEYPVIQESLSTLPLLAAKKMVILQEAGKNKQFLENYEQLLTGLPDSTDLILVEPKLDKRLSYYKFLKSKTDFKEFPNMDESGLARWLTTAAREQGGSINLADARYLVERVGNDQDLLWRELEKLLIYDSNVSRRTIDLLTEPAPSSTIFQLLEAVFAGNRQRALRLYGEQRDLKVEPQQIIAMLAWQLHVLAIIKAAGNRTSDQIAKEAKINPFVVRKSQGLAGKVSLIKLRSLISNLLEIDVRGKSTNIDLDDALQHYLLKLGSDQ